jgi:hypothetical protein
MNASANPLKDLAFWDQLRRLQQGCTGNIAGSTGSATGFNVIGTYLIGFVIITLTITGIVKLVRHGLSTRRVNAVDVPELPQHDEKRPKIPKSTLAKRKQTILELFETSQVTMVSNDNKQFQNKQFAQRRRQLTISQSFQKVSKDDIMLGAEDDCIEDIESGSFDDGGILKLSRPVVAISSNPTTNASSPLPPPEWCDVPNMCAICLDSYEPGQVIAWSSGCRHAFHQDCISHYLAKKMIGGESPCPSCRQKFCDLPKEPSISSSSIAGNGATTSESTEAGHPSL